MKTRLIAILLPLAFAGLTARAHGAIIFNLIPANGQISGSGGQTIGWGYTITNNTANFLQPFSLGSVTFPQGTPNAIFDFPELAPGQTITQPFSKVVTAACPVPDCGFYEVTLFNSAPVGTVLSGTFTISSEFFSDAAENNDAGAAPDVTATYSATVTSAVPEPASVGLAFAGLLLVARNLITKRSAVRRC